MSHWSTPVSRLGCAAFLACVAIVSAGARGDVITDWNNVLIDTTRATGGPPGPISRNFALMHAAMYDAYNSANPTAQPYKFFVPTPAGTSEDAAAASAAYRVLTSVFPGRKSIYDAALAQSLAAIPNGPGKIDGLALGQSVADSMIALRSTDGFDKVVTYTFGNNPGDFRPTMPYFQPQPASPSWGECTPWTLVKGDQLRPPLPPALDSAAYAAAFNDVKKYGAMNSPDRSQEQTNIAWFWANDRDGSYKPPGQLNYITQVVAKAKGNTTAQNARLFALENLAMADAGIAAWDSKYDTDVDFWRPIAGIREADTDGNSDTDADANWEPLNNLPTPMASTAVGTPPFPAYVSGHATFGATHAAVLRDFYGSDDFTFTIGSDDMPADYLRTFHSFSEAALENGRSRIYLGVHWQFDADQGYVLGSALGDYVTANFLQVPEPSGTLVIVGAGTLLIRRRARR